MSETLSNELLEQIKIKNLLLVEGLDFSPKIFENLDDPEKYAEQVNALFSPDHHPHTGVEFPACFFTEKGGFRVQLRWNKKSPYKLVFEDGRFQIKKENEVIHSNVVFTPRSKYYGKLTSDGVAMRTVAQDYGYRNMFISYSNECSLKDKGLDCLFCNINATKALYGDSQGIHWKTAKQVGETIAEGYKEGFNKLTISGGFIPERREVDYYIDVAEEIKEATGLEDFNGTACVGAPLDLTVFEKYKEAGFKTIATNLEIWDKNIFDTICPGKKEFCGGRENWLKAIDYELELFGRFHVRSTFVSGIEPKNSLLEGIEHLVEKGVVALPSQWNVNVGSALEGSRTPEAEWHWDVFEKTIAIYRKNGLKWQQLREATANPDTVVHDLFRWYEGIPTEEIA
ncbi:MAG: nitrogen fixation protein NifB [Lachnospiraceae bacterium]|nr:nitrogen fixation protein NifB [Lachnospiraceae bacterium]